MDTQGSKRESVCEREGKAAKQLQQAWHTRSSKNTLCAKKEVFPCSSLCILTSMLLTTSTTTLQKQPKCSRLYFGPSNTPLGSGVLIPESPFFIPAHCSSVQIWNPFSQGPRVRSSHRGHQDHDHHPRKEPLQADQHRRRVRCRQCSRNHSAHGE